MTPEFEQLAQFVEYELTNEHCAGPCHVCSGRTRGRPGLPPWSVVMAGPALGFGQYHPILADPNPPVLPIVDFSSLETS